MHREMFTNYSLYAREQAIGTNARIHSINTRLKIDHFSRLAKTESVVYRKNLKAHYGCVNAVEFSNNGGLFIASGGDDKRVLLWNTHKALSGVGSPTVMSSLHESNIFCLAFDNENKTIISGGNDQHAIIHDIESQRSLQVYFHEDVVYGISIDPCNSNLFGTAGDDGRLLIMDSRVPSNEGPLVLATSMTPMHGLKHNPVDSRIIASANSGDGTMLWDIRRPKKPFRTCARNETKDSKMVMSVTFDKSGTKFASLRKWSGLVMYDLFDPEYSVEFEHEGYLNSCTMKSCTFSGENDEYLLSGSDDFNLYLWKVPESGDSDARKVKEVHRILGGHRSIVNQVRYSPENCLIISSGVEKIIKVWSPFPIGDGSPSSVFEEPRSQLTIREYYSMSPLDMLYPVGQVRPMSTEEDPNMLAFFDTLVSREREGRSSTDWPLLADQNDSDEESSRDSYDYDCYLDGDTNSPENEGNDDDHDEADDQDDESDSESGAEKNIGSLDIGNASYRSDSSSSNYDSDQPQASSSSFQQFLLSGDVNRHTTGTAEGANNDSKKRKHGENEDDTYAKTHWKKKKISKLDAELTLFGENLLSLSFPCSSTEPLTSEENSNVGEGEDQTTEDKRNCHAGITSTRDKTITKSSCLIKHKGRTYRHHNKNNSSDEEVDDSFKKDANRVQNNEIIESRYNGNSDLQPPSDENDLVSATNPNCDNTSNRQSLLYPDVDDASLLSLKSGELKFHEIPRQSNHDSPRSNDNSHRLFEKSTPS